MKAVRLIALSTVLFSLLFAANAQARTLHVNGSATQPGDGSSWSAPFTTLTDALTAAADGDRIWVAAGTYVPTAGTDRKASFRLKEGVEIYGGFAGNETELKKRDFKRNQTILSGDIGQPGTPDDNVYHVVTGADRAVLDGFTITGGYSANMGWDGPRQLSPSDVVAGYHQGMGAGMLIFRTAPEVRNCVFQDNHALIGGAVYVMTSTAENPTAPAPTAPRFIDCVFWQNSALAHGGGAAIFLRTAPLFVSCVFDSNLADIKGGGMFNDFGAAPKLLNTIFRNNEAPAGGGMANDGGSQPALSYSTFTGNRALKSGPAIHQSGGQPNTTLLLKTVVWDNQCECADSRFFNGQMSVVRVQDSVIQGGYEGKSVFQANPGLNRMSETLLNVGYKTDGHRFRADKIKHRVRDIERSQIAGNLPAYDDSYVAVVDPKLLSAVAVAPDIPIPASAPTPTPAVAPQPERAAIPESQPTPPTPEPEPAVPEAVVQPEPEAVAKIEPQPAPAIPRPAAQPTDPSSADQSMQQLDFDGNGCITLNEASGPLQQQFWRIDNNGDGCISKIELDRFESRGKKRVQQPQLAQQQAQPQPIYQPAIQPQPKPAPSKAKPSPAASTAPAPQPKQTAPTKQTAATKPSTASPAGYTLFAPIGGTETYLINKRGNVVKKWTGNDRSSGAVYLLNNGNLLRSVSPARGEVNTPFQGAGINGGIIQEVSPRGQVVWEYAYVDNRVRQHHDIEPLPNGNILILAWELKNQSEIAAAGGTVRSHPDGQVWAEHIMEVRKSGPRSGYVVWEWHSWDHLVQDADSGAPNYANPARMPQRINVNYNPTRGADWHHANSIDYNPVSRQILLSLRNLNEVWVIDHSTDTTQAASGSGGVMRRGGDLLFRWGNPAAYGGTGKQVLFGQHDATWITGARPGDETILVFNNDDNRTQQSDVIEIKPAYYFKSTQLNAQVVWSYGKPGGKRFFADASSGAQRLANGNTLVCDGPAAHLFEVTPSGKTVWEYQHPTSDTEAGKHIFRATRLPANHPGIKRLGIK